MKRLLFIVFLSLAASGWAQKKPAVRKAAATAASPKINDSVAALIPVKIDGKFGFQDQRGKKVIAAVYSNVGFFTEDCNLLNSPNVHARKFGSAAYASVRLQEKDYRIDTSGKRVYTFKESDLGKCDIAPRNQLFHAYVKNGYYGIIEDSKFTDPEDYRQFTIYPQYEYMHILEGDDLHNPMIIAVRNGLFGILDVHHRLIVPFQYADIKPNYAWKLARLFEVSRDGKNYFYIDMNNRSY